MLRTALALALTLAAAANASQHLRAPAELEREQLELKLPAPENSRHGVSDNFDGGIGPRASSTPECDCEIFLVAPGLAVVRLEDSFSLYAFAAFDPINNWDPFGLKNTCLTPDCGPVGRSTMRDLEGGGPEETLHLGGLPRRPNAGAAGKPPAAPKPPPRVPVCYELCQADRLAEALEKNPVARDKLQLEGVTVEQALKEGLLKETEQAGTPDPAQADAFAKEASKPGGFLDKEADALNAAGFYDLSKQMAAGAAGVGGLRATVRTMRPLTPADLGLPESSTVVGTFGVRAGKATAYIEKLARGSNQSLGRGILEARLRLMDAAREAGATTLRIETSPIIEETGRLASVLERAGFQARGNGTMWWEGPVR